MIQLQATKDQVLLGPTTAATTTRSASFDWAGADYAVVKVFQSASAGTNGGCSISLLSADSVPTQATQFATITADLTAQATTSHEVVYFCDLRRQKLRKDNPHADHEHERLDHHHGDVDHGAARTGAEQHRVDGCDDERFGRRGLSFTTASPSPRRVLNRRAGDSPTHLPA
jgi:hypothetical protein